MRARVRASVPRDRPLPRHARLRAGAPDEQQVRALLPGRGRQQRQQVCGRKLVLGYST